MRKLKLERNAEQIENRKSWLRKIASEMSWREDWEKPEEAHLRLKRDDVFISIWYTTMKIGIFIKTKFGEIVPKYHKVLDEDEMVEILANPHKYWL